MNAASRRRELRRNQTDAELRLWGALRQRGLAVFKFRRQHDFGPYVLDFYCPERHLAVELDGGQHFTPAGLAKDEARGRYLQTRGITVLRFSDRDVLLEINAVLEAILEALFRPSP